MIRYILEHKSTKIAFDAPDEDSAICVAFHWGEDHSLGPGDKVDVYKATGAEMDLPVDESVIDF